MNFFYIKNKFFIYQKPSFGDQLISSLIFLVRDIAMSVLFTMILILFMEEIQEIHYYTKEIFLNLI